MLPRRTWQEMTANDIAAADTGRWIAVLPIAAVEPHGGHLPLATDAEIARGHVERVAELMPDDLPATFLPLLSVGWSEEHRAFAGMLTLSPETLIRVLTEIGESLCHSGLKKLVIVNSHGGNSPVVDIVIQKLRTDFKMLAVAASWSRFGLPEGLFPAAEKAFGIHGGAIETSLMLHLRPDLVAMEKADRFPSAQETFAEDFRHLRAYGPARFGWRSDDLNPAGVVGDARLASAEAGRAILDHAAGGFLELLADVDRFDADRFA
ncbi:creatinine amidohydrolase [Rhodobium orientis]|uniref:Creatininase n=1 Tax=Rhodobium orientis TaxID=34017 RepID=A0A327JGY4_9HYPH|nr:creatininase family protein [Rhodobium orientis]MBB4304451.1 creatinine amidohydrolase [Rhodobium orientis]MBK5949976.1 creatininase [Rhodobium orientis]RAI25599.1 creatininase [Rhodobium orientis]